MVYAWFVLRLSHVSFFSFHFLSFSISVPQIDYFYYLTPLHGLQDVENHCPLLRDIELKTGTKIAYLRFPQVCMFLYVIRLKSMKLQNKKKKYLVRIQEKDTKTSTKRQEGNGMTQNALFDVFHNAHA